MNAKQLHSVILDTLEFCGMICSDNVVNMIIETACVESNCGEYIKQLKGPACSIFQIEPNTAKDIIQNFIVKNRLRLQNFNRLYNSNLTLEQNLCTNLMFAIFMCRCFYLRIKEPIPSTIELRAKYWKKYYNTEKGKGTVEKYIKAVEKFYK